MTERKNSSAHRTLILCLICTFLWGAGYPVVKISCAGFGIENADIFGKLVHAGARFTIAGGLLLAYHRLRCKAAPQGKKTPWPRIMLLGLCQTVLQYGLLYVGLANTSGTKGSVLNQVNVFLLVLLTPIFFPSEKITRRKVLGCALGFSGIVVMNLKGLSFTMEMGDLLVILSSCSAAAGYLVSKTMASGGNAIANTGCQQLFGGLILLGTGLAGGGRLREINPTGVATFAFLVLAAAAAYSIWFSLLMTNDLGAISVYKFLTPIFGMLLSGLLLKETIFTLANMTALVLVCAGLITVNRAPRGMGKGISPCRNSPSFWHNRKGFGRHTP